MANREHVKLLKQGVPIWNRWRQEHPEMRPDLQGVDLFEASLDHADLHEADLHSANLSRASLREANLTRVDVSFASLNEVHLEEAMLYEANLQASSLVSAHLSSARVSDAVLSWTQLCNADLTKAVLSGAQMDGVDLYLATLCSACLIGVQLREARLVQADLTGADLSSSDLRRADFTRACLRRAEVSNTFLSFAMFVQTLCEEINLDHARVFHTIWSDVDLRSARGLETIDYQGPSLVDARTVLLPEGDAGRHFLRGAGFAEEIVLSHLAWQKISSEKSFFLCIAIEDEALGTRLSADLQESGVRCWLALHEIGPTTSFYQILMENLPLQETVIVFLSSVSLKSRWPKSEVDFFLRRQEEEQRSVLMVVFLDQGALENDDPWVVDVRERVPLYDFTGWQDEQVYQQRLADLRRFLLSSASSQS